MGEYFTTQGAEGDCAQGLPSGGCYAAVIADVSLTGGRGAEGLELVRWARERDPSTRIIILTAYGSGETEREARRLGPARFSASRCRCPRSQPPCSI
jgi:DNA-binding NarL/FixJ family response regulator